MLYETLEKSQRRMMICLQYSTKEILSIELISEKIIVILQRLSKEHGENPGSLFILLIRFYQEPFLPI